MTSTTLNAFVNATARYMDTLKGKKNQLFVLHKGCTIEGVIIACAHKATKCEHYATLQEVAEEIIRQETAQRVGYMKVGA